MSTCTCNTCSGKIEFERSQAGQTIQCPHCGIDTVLFIPGIETSLFGSAKQPPKSEPAFNSVRSFTGNPGMFQTCPTCASRISITANSCPKCGHVFKYAGGVNLKDPVHVIGLGICVLIVVLVVIYILSQVQ